MLPVPFHKEFRLTSSTPFLTWANHKPPTAGALVDIWWLYLTMQRASKLGLTLGGPGLATARAVAEAALSVCSWDATGYQLTPAYSRLKDYVKPFLSGTIGAGLTLLQMGQAGFPWMAHWEDCQGQTATAHPDFAFFRDATAFTPAAVCLVESKGSRSTTTDTKLQEDWEQQVWSNRNHPLTLPGGKLVWPTEGRLVSSELPGPTGKKRFRSALVRGSFLSRLPGQSPGPSPVPVRGPGSTATDRQYPQDQQDRPPEIDWWGVHGASLRHTCRLLDMPLTGTVFASRRLYSAPVDLLARQPRPVARAIARELRNHRALMKWGDQSESDPVYAGPPQIVVRDGIRWTVTLYCRSNVLRPVLRGRRADVALAGAERRDVAWQDSGRWAIRLEAADGVGLMVREVGE